VLISTTAKGFVSWEKCSKIIHTMRKLNISVQFIFFHPKDTYLLFSKFHFLITTVEIRYFKISKIIIIYATRFCVNWAFLVAREARLKYERSEDFKASVEKFIKLALIFVAIFF
jgi:hypothetical protein